MNPITSAAVCEALKAGHTITFNVHGNSMRPTFRHGDSLRVAYLNRPPMKGDILVYADNCGPVVHRVIDISGTVLGMRGDGAIRTETIRIDQVRGIVVQAKRGEIQIATKRLFAPFAWRAGLRIYQRLLLIRSTLLSFFSYS